MKNLPFCISCLLSANDCWILSPKDYWYAFVSAVAGAMISIWWTIGKFKRDEAIATNHCIKRIGGCLEFNLDRLRDAKEYLDKTEFPNFPFDTSQLNYWLTKSYDVLGNKLFREIDWQRYQLDHITSKMEVINPLIVLNGTRSRSLEEQEYLISLRNDLKSHIDGAIDALPNLIQEVKERELKPRNEWFNCCRDETVQ